MTDEMQEAIESVIVAVSGEATAIVEALNDPDLTIPMVERQINQALAGHLADTGVTLWVVTWVMERGDEVVIHLHATEEGAHRQASEIASDQGYETVGHDTWQHPETGDTLDVTDTMLDR